MQLPPRDVFIEEYLTEYMDANREAVEDMEIEEIEAMVKQVEQFAGARFDYITRDRKEPKSYTIEEMEGAICE